MVRTAVSSIAATIACLAVGTVAPAVAAPPGPPDTDVVISAAKALARGTGVGEAAAQRRLDREAVQTAVAERLSRSLGPDRSAGSWIDEGGSLRVAVTDAWAAAGVRTAGAVPVTVARSERRLTAHAAALGAAARAGRIDEVGSWGIDPVTNSVRVQTAGLRRDGAAARLVASSGGAVSVEVVPARTMTTALALVGGREFTGVDAGGAPFSCSVGFGARDANKNQRMVTAGHCLADASGFRARDLTLGNPLAVSFPGDDYGALKVFSRWKPVGRVELWNGEQTPVRGSTVAAVGATVCKSGRTTKWTCGRIVSYQNTVNYGNGEVVSGLTRHNACVEPGDSGGANLSNGQAQGVSSGGALYPSGGRYVCGAKVGKTTISFFQPVREILSAYRLSLVLQ